MKVLFVTLLDFYDISEHGLYTDLLRTFIENGHEVTIVSPIERRSNKPAVTISHTHYKIVKPRIGNIQKTNYVEKALSLFMLNKHIMYALSSTEMQEELDLILYATPPITISRLIKALKRKSDAKTFLMLKDIWPQEMVDLSLIKDGGLIERYFRYKEKELYSISDWIGCTSQANVDYIIAHNRDVNKEKLTIVHNGVEPCRSYSNQAIRAEIRHKYNIPDDTVMFFYGGNLGKAQGVDFLLECLLQVKGRSDCFFVICGSGTEYSKINDFFITYMPNNMLLLPYLSKENYDNFIKASDVGMVFLNSAFTVPNDPSRFYAYLEQAKPVLACTDLATDIKNEIIENQLGWWCESKDANDFFRIFISVLNTDIKALEAMGNRARAILEEKYNVFDDYKRIMSCVLNRENDNV